MKSSINPRMVIQPKVIGYCIADEKKEKIMNIIQELNVDLSLIGKESAGNLVGRLASINGVPADCETVENPPECEALIMSGLKETVMNRFLKLLRENNVVIDLKCILTPTNQTWRLYALIEELKREHEIMNKTK